MSDSGGALTRDVLLRVKAQNLSTADFQQLTAQVNNLTAAIDKQVEAASRGAVKERELAQTLDQFGQAIKNVGDLSKTIDVFKTFDAQLTKQRDAVKTAAAALDAYRLANTDAATGDVKATKELASKEQALKRAENAVKATLKSYDEYKVKIEQAGFSVNNLAEAENRLKALADQIGPAVQKLTQARENYARILRETTQATKEQEAADKAAAKAAEEHAKKEQELAAGVERAIAALKAKQLADVQAGTQQLRDRAEQEKRIQADIAANAAKAAADAKKARMDAIRETIEANNRAREQELQNDRKIAADRAKLAAEVAAGARGYNDDAAAARMAKLREEIELNNRLHQERNINAQNEARNSQGVLGRLQQEVQLQRQSARETVNWLRARIDGYRNVRTVIGETDKAEEEAAQRRTQRGRTQGGQTGRPNLLNLQPYEMTNLGYQGVDVVQGFLSGVAPGIIAAQQGPQIVQIFGTSILKWTPIIVAGLGAIAVAMGTFQRAFREASSTREFTAQLTDNAAAINYSVAQLNEIRKAARDMGMSWTEAGAAIKTAIDNNIAQDRLKQLLQAAQDVKDLTGKDVPNAMKEFSAALTGSADDLLKLNDAYHFLSREEMQHVRDQFAAGEADKARAETLDKLSKTLRDRAKVGLDPWTDATRQLRIAWDDLLVSLSKTQAFKDLYDWLIKNINEMKEFADAADKAAKNPFFTGGGLGGMILKGLFGPDWEAAKRFLEKFGSLPPEGGGKQPGDAGYAPIPGVPITPQQQSANQKQVSQWLAARDYSATAIAGIMGNASVESSFNPANVNATGHFGLFQWDKTRQAALGNPPSTDIAKQMELMDKELEKLDPTFKKATGSVEEMALRFEKVFERSGGQMNAERVRDAQKFREVGAAAAGGAAPSGPVSTAPTKEQERTGQKLVEQEQQKLAIQQAQSIEAERQARYAELRRKIGEETQDPAAQKQLFDLRKQEIDLQLARDAADLQAKRDREKIDNARHYNEIVAAGNKAVEDALKTQNLGWREQERIRDQAQAKEKDRLDRIDQQNKTLQSIIKTVDDLKRANDSAFGSDLEKRLDAIHQKYINIRKDLEERRQTLTQVEKGPADAAIAGLPAEEEREKLKATRDALLAQAEAAASARSDLINSANKQREAGAISIDEQQQKVKEAYALTTPEIEKATAALEKWLETAKAAGLPAIEIEKVRAKIADLRVEAKYVDPFLKGLQKTIEDSFTNHAAEAFDSVAEAIGGLIAKTKDWKDVWTSLRNAAANFFAGILKDIATYIIKAQLAKMVSSFMPGLGGLFGGTSTTAATSAAGAAATGTASQVGVTAAIVHGGGIIGLTQTPMRAVQGDWFNRAPRYHNGSVVGLAANEQAAILQSGEEVLTANNPRHARNWSGGGGAVPVAIRNVLVMDEGMIPQAMAGSHGERTTMAHIQKNIATIRQMVK